MKGIKTYLSNLSNHPGLFYAAYFSLMGLVAGAQRGSVRAALFGGLVMSVFWIPVLITSHTSHAERYDDRSDI